MAPHRLSGSQAERVDHVGAAARGPGQPFAMSRGIHYEDLRLSRYAEGGSCPASARLALPEPAKGMPAKVDMAGLKGFKAGPVTDSCSSASSEVQQMGTQSAEEAGGLVKGAWSAEEDALLLQYVQVRQTAREGGSSAATAPARETS
jgi:hypothetical protein